MVSIRGRTTFSKATTLLMALLLVMTIVGSASAATIKGKRDEAIRLKNQIDGLSKGLNKLASEYSAAVTKLSNIEYEIVLTERELEKAQKELERNQHNLAKRTQWLYQNGTASFMDVVFGANSFEEFLVRIDTLVRVGQADGILIKKIKVVKGQIEEHKTDLEGQKQRQSAVAANLRALGKQMNAKLNKQQALLSRVQGELAALIEQERARELARARAVAMQKVKSQRKVAVNQMPPGVKRVSRGGATPPGYTRVGNFLFPVQGPAGFSNDWGQPRGGGRRSHKGTDIFASRGTPVVATVGGTVQQRSGGSAGLWASLKGSDGNTYYFMHLDSYGKGGSVSAGDVIGYVGDSGNARGTSPHLHFEFHPGGGGAVNPYPHLQR